MNLVIDSGVWISAVQFGGLPRQVIEDALADDVVFLCDEIIEEVDRIMHRKFGGATGAFREWVSEFPSGPRLLSINYPIPAICRDHKDDMVLACAVQAGAMAIVSGDKDLLALHPLEDIRIVNPRDFSQWRKSLATALP